MAAKKELEVVKNEPPLPAARSSSISGEAMAPGDILIPKIFLQQNTSQFVNEDKAKPGDFVRSVNAEILGGREKPLSFIPLAYIQKWIIFEIQGSTVLYKGTAEYTAKNADQPWDYEVEGVKYRRDKSIELFCLLTDDIAAEALELEQAKKQGGYPDPDKALLPVVISFRRTSYKAGQKILTHFSKAMSFNVPGYVSVFSLKNTKETNDRGTFFVLDVDKARQSNPAELKVADKWQGIINSGAAKVHEMEETESKPVVETNEY